MPRRCREVRLCLRVEPFESELALMPSIEHGATIKNSNPRLPARPRRTLVVLRKTTSREGFAKRCDARRAVLDGCLVGPFKPGHVDRGPFGAALAHIRVTDYHAVRANQVPPRHSEHDAKLLTRNVANIARNVRMSVDSIEVSSDFGSEGCGFKSCRDRQQSS